MGKLTSKTVESIAKAATPGKTNDGDGLYFQVSKSGGTSWIFRYKLDGRSREMGLGPFPAVTLSQARQLAADQRKLLASGSDPLATRDAAKEAKREAEKDEPNGQKLRALLHDANEMVRTFTILDPAWQGVQRVARLFGML